MSRGLMLWGVALAFSNVAISQAAAYESENPHRNFTVINPKVDALLKKSPDWVFDVFASLIIALGALFAFFGLKTVRLQSTFFGACICGGLASFLLYLIPGEESAELWLGVVIPFSVLGGYLLGRIVTLRKFILFISFGVAIAGVFNQYALSYISIVPDFIIWTVMILSLILSAVFIWRYFSISAIIASSFLGGFLVLLGTARLMRGEISLTGTFGFGTVFQLCRRRCENKGKKLSEEPIGLDEIESMTPSKRHNSESSSPRSQRQSSYRTPKRTPKTTSKRTTPANPFAPGPNDDPLIVELTETLDSRRRKRNSELDLA